MWQLTVLVLALLYLYLPDGMGGRRYERLSYMAKAALTLSLSYAVPKHGFSISNAMLGKDKLSLAENTLVAQRVFKDIITKDISTSARRAYVDYCVHLEEQRCQTRTHQEMR